jgi:hypothetical protein
VCSVLAKKTGAANLYTRRELKTNELPKIINIIFLIEDFSFCFVYRQLGVFSTGFRGWLINIKALTLFRAQLIKNGEGVITLPFT